MILVAAYLMLNAVVIAAGIFHLLQSPSAISNWQNALLSSPRVGRNWMMVNRHFAVGVSEAGAGGFLVSRPALR